MQHKIDRKANTTDHIYSNTNNEKRKRGTHLNFEARVTIKVLKQQGFSNRAIAKQLNCSPSTIGYELKRGTADYGGRGRKPSYSAKRGQTNYDLDDIPRKRLGYRTPAEVFEEQLDKIYSLSD